MQKSFANRARGEQVIIVVIAAFVASAAAAAQAVALYFVPWVLVGLLVARKLIPSLAAPFVGASLGDELAPHRPHLRRGVAVELANEITEAEGMAPVSILVLRSDKLNALSTKLVGPAQVALTPAALNLESEALRALLAHEIGHVKARDSIRGLVRATLVGLATPLLWVALLLSSGGPSSFWAALVWTLAAVGVQLGAELLGRAHSRRRENQADRFAARATSSASVAALMSDLHAVAPRRDLWWRLEDVFYTHPASHNRLARFART